MIFSPHKDFKIAVYLFEPDPELHSGTERSSFSDKFRRPGLEPLVLSVILAGSGPVIRFFFFFFFFFFFLFFFVFFFVFFFYR